MFFRPAEGPFGELELPRQHSDNCGGKQTSPGDPHQWRTGPQGGVDEGREGKEYRWHYDYLCSFIDK